MKKLTVIACMTLVCIATVAFARFGGGTENQSANVGSTPRYQISAFGYGTKSNDLHGAYIVDTVTGDVFLTLRGNEPKPIGRATTPERDN